MIVNGVWPKSAIHLSRNPVCHFGLQTAQVSYQYKYMYALGEISQRSSPASDTRVGVMKPSAFAAPTSPRRSQLVEAALFVLLHQSSPEAK